MAEAAVISNAARNVTDPREARRLIRNGAHTDHTVFIAPGYVQGNLVIVPAGHADDLLRYCQRNPKPCPLLAVSDPGDPRLPELAEDLDIRTDVPSYRVFRDGELVEEVTDIRSLWRDDFVAFVLGCSFSFEQALIEDGLPMAHVRDRKQVAMYLTNIDTIPAGPFRGKMVVSMRPFTPAQAIRAIQITTRFPGVHGAPVHVGLPELIGIEDIHEAWDSPSPEIGADQIPVFWACGVTPQIALRQARLPVAITHTPGHMVITDRLNTSLAVL